MSETWGVRMTCAAGDDGKRQLRLRVFRSPRVAWRRRGSPHPRRSKPAFSPLTRSNVIMQPASREVEDPGCDATRSEGPAAAWELIAVGES
jgi:hypothetical protein